MNTRYLLYIDILGFQNLVGHAPEKVPDLFELIDSLNVHRHDAFKTVAFSDTVLVYNAVDPVSDHDHEYIMMYLCEFAQDLLHRLVGTAVYFRGLICHGEFTHYLLRHVEVFYGPALIDAYLKEKSINCMGLFIEKTCLRWNKIFPVAKFDENLSFVYLTQSLERLWQDSSGILPVDPLIIEGVEFYLAAEVKLLEIINRMMLCHLEPAVRSKFLMFWQFYRSRYRKLIDTLEERDFEPAAVCPSHNWSQYSFPEPWIRNLEREQ